MTRAPDMSLTERDASLLGPLAEHRILIVPQVALLLGVSERTALSRLRALERNRLLQLRPIFQGLPQAASIQSRGLRALGSPLKAPQLNLNEYRHDVGVGWLWLAARAGRFGELRTLTVERQMQAEDAAVTAGGGSARWGVGLGLFNSHGRPQRHYPDLMLDTTSGHRVAVELELTLKSSGRIGRIMSSYASDATVDEVLYLVANRAIGNRVLEAARRAGIPELVHVQMLAPDGIAGAEVGRSVSRDPGPRHASTRATNRAPGSAPAPSRQRGSAER